MSPFRRIVVWAISVLAVLLIGGLAYYSSVALQKKKAAYQETESLQQLRQAAGAGNADAQTRLGLLYYRGRGVPQDFTEALRWSRRAADQGDAVAQFNLGFMYAKGRGGIPPDYAEAALWYRKAAGQGNVDAQFNLGLMYYNGQGVPRDSVEAHMWLSLAVSRAAGDDVKKFTSERDLVARKMTPRQIAEAQRRAAEWEPMSGEDQDAGPAK
jgi:TPR repeat protein